jgi:enterochelin esterase family protein
MFSERFSKDLLEEVIPLVERKYRVTAGADQRAIAGLSMGGGQALTIGLAHPELFHYVLGYSAAVGAQIGNSDDVVTRADASALNTKMRLIWIGIGKQDFLHQANRQFTERLTAKGVKFTFRETEGAHVWSVWRNYLNETAPMLFTARR